MLYQAFERSVARLKADGGVAWLLLNEIAALSTPVTGATASTGSAGVMGLKGRTVAMLHPFTTGESKEHFFP